MSDSVAVVQTIASFVPSCLVRQIVADSVPAAGEITPVEAAVLFADISGFTPMSEALSQTGRQGAEEMNQHLNDTFSATIAHIVARRGEVAAFGGDAILSFFQRESNETQTQVAWRALTCAAEMQRAMAAFVRVETLAGPFSLRMKFGLSFGRIIIVNVGSRQHGLEFVIAGAPVDRAGQNENYAESGQIIADTSLLDLVGDRVSVSPITAEIKRVLDVEPAPAEPARPFDYAGLNGEQRQTVLQAVAPYLPQKLYEDMFSKGKVIGDHRPVTNMFLYFAGLDYDHDVAVGQKLQTYVAHAQEIVHRYDGTLNRVLTGDKGSEMHIFFGAPVTHEDDKARALRCALSLQKLPGILPFIHAQRIGVASGYVFAGPVGAVAHQHHTAMIRGEYTAMGDIVNLSARLTGICPPAQIMVDEYTRSRTAQRFEFSSFGSVKLKGKSRSVTPFLLEQERAAENTLVTRYLLSQRSLVGRQEEKALIERVVSAALQGRGQVLAITGPAGVGKSRLVEEAVRRWLNVQGIGYGGDCISHGAEIPYWPWADLWRAQFDLYEADAPQERQAKIIRAGHALGMDLGVWTALVASLLGLPLGVDGEEHPALAPLDPQARHQRLLDLTLELITAQAQQAPMLLLFEDLHWADHSSLELIDYVSRRIADLPVLICMAYRPRDSVSLNCLDGDHCHVLSLRELSADEETDLIYGMLGNVDLPRTFLRLINAKAQGNPLFVEEFVNGLVDARLLRRENGVYRVVGDLDQIEVPDTIEAVMLARIDRLTAPARDLLRIASVIGRQFAFNVLLRIYPFTIVESEMLSQLAGLERLDLTRLERPEPELEYLFKHALTHEVAYKSLSFTLRRDLHRRIGDFLEHSFADHIETMYGTLTHHFARGGQTAQALPYALAAGRQAQALYANDEALAYYRQAETLLKQLPSHQYQTEAIQLFLNRGELGTILGNFDEAEADLARGLELARGEQQDRRAQAQALSSWAYLRYWQAQNEDMLRLAQEALELAEADGCHYETMMALRYIAVALEGLGRHDDAIGFFARAQEVAEALGDRQALSVIHMGMAVSAFNRGRLRNALDSLSRLLTIYRDSGDKHRMTDCLTNIANTQVYLGEYDAARATFQESIAIDRSIGKRAGLAYSLCDFGRLCCQRGEYRDGLAAMEEALTIFYEMGDDAGQAYCELVLAREYHLDAGSRPQVKELLARALPVLQANESFEEEAEALLALGWLAWEQRASDQARVHGQRALVLCEEHNLYWRLPEATVLLSRAALTQGDTQKARDGAHRTLDAIAAGGCPDFKAVAHLVLGQLAPDPLQYYQQAVHAARERGRCIDLARTLFFVGSHLHDQAQMELQAMGEAYIQEASLLWQDMGLPPETLSK